MSHETTDTVASKQPHSCLYADETLDPDTTDVQASVARTRTPLMNGGAAVVAVLGSGPFSSLIWIVPPSGSTRFLLHSGHPSCKRSLFSAFDDSESEVPPESLPVHTPSDLCRGLLVSHSPPLPLMSLPASPPKWAARKRPTVSPNADTLTFDMGPVYDDSDDDDDDDDPFSSLMEDGLVRDGFTQHGGCKKRIHSDEAWQKRCEEREREYEDVWSW